MVMLAGGFSDILAPGISQVVSKEYKRYEKEYNKFLNEISLDKQYAKTTTIEGVGVAERVYSGASVPFRDLTQGYDKTHTAEKYGMGLRIDEDLYEDDLYDQMNQGAEWLGRSIRQAIETHGASIFVDGFTSGTGPDSSYLFATAHPWARGGTYSNRTTNQVTLSATVLSSALSAFEGQTDEAGAPVQIMAKTVLVPPELRFDISVILESALKSGTANNDKNPLLDLDLNYMVGHYLTDAADSFILGDKHFCNFWMRRRPKFVNDDDFGTGDALFKVTSRYKAGWASPLGVYGLYGV